MLAALVFALATAAAQAPPPSGFTVDERHEYYVVDATRSHELAKQMEAAMAALGFPDSGAARTVQVLETRYELDPTPTGCRLKDLSVRLEATVHLPAWRPAGRVGEKLRQRWRRMREALEAHEAQHVDLAIQTGRRLHAALLELPEDQDCRTLAREAQRLLFRARLSHAIRDEAFDRRTRHGISQGARL